MVPKQEQAQVSQNQHEISPPLFGTHLYSSVTCVGAQTGFFPAAPHLNLCLNTGGDLSDRLL